MRVLWISDNAFPEVYESLKIVPRVNAGWVYSAANSLLDLCSDVELATAVVMDVPKIQIIVSNRIKHYLIPMEGRRNTKFWENILNDFCPSFIHVHGTEYPHLFTFIKSRTNEKVIISIQGLVSVIQRYYFGGITTKDLLSSITLRDIVRFDTVFQQKNDMEKRAINERKAIRSVDAIIGRTEWDKVHALAINPSIRYFHNDETLRKCFYQGKWDWSTCYKYRIFISQGHYPIKGLHQLLRALPLVISAFPQTQVYISGHDFFSNRGIKINGYGRFINRLIDKLSLRKHVHFTGLLDEEGMKEQYLNAHVFVCPSAIENSPNSLGEAQMLGTPVIASYVGGISSMVEHYRSGLLYRFEEFEQLAMHINNVFSNQSLCEILSQEGRTAAKFRHDPLRNAMGLVQIYKALNEA